MWLAVEKASEISPEPSFAHEPVFTDRCAVDAKLVAAAVVGVDQHSNREPIPADLDDPRRGADAALEAVQLRARSRADSALGHRPPAGRLQRRQDVLGP